MLLNSGKANVRGHTEKLERCGLFFVVVGNGDKIVIYADFWLDFFLRFQDHFLLRE